MTRDWESTFSGWIGKASDSEQDRYERTCKAIGDALRASSRLEAYDYTVYAKGSYPNFTNVVRDSDVDIAVELTTFFKPKFVHAAKGSPWPMSASANTRAMPRSPDSRTTSSRR